MAIPFPDNIDLGVGNPIDSKYLNTANEPYSGETEVNTRISESQRYVGLTVNINNSEYWYKNGTTDISLIPKSLGGVSDLTGATNGLSLTGGGTQVALGGTLTGDTEIYGSGTTFNIVNTNNSDANMVKIEAWYADCGALGSTFSNHIWMTPGVGMEMYQYDTSGCRVGLKAAWNGVVLITDTIANKGAEYAGNYSAASCLNPRWIPDNAYVTGLTTSASNVVNVCNVFTTGYTATQGNDFIGVSGASCIYLPPTPKPCQRITVADICGCAVLNSIQINGNGNCINGDSIATINTDYGSMTFINNNISGWTAVAFIN